MLPGVSSRLLGFALLPPPARGATNLPFPCAPGATSPVFGPYHG